MLYFDCSAGSESLESTEHKFLSRCAQTENLLRENVADVLFDRPNIVCSTIVQ